MQESAAALQLLELCRSPEEVSWDIYL